MSGFKRLPQHRLQDLSDEELVGYAAAARDAGDTEAEREAIAYLAFAWEPYIRAKVALKVPVEDRVDVVLEVQASLIHSNFQGKVVGQFGAFVRTIAQRRIADYHRKRSRRPRLEAGDGNEGEPTTDETGYVALRAVVEQLLAKRSPLHQKVIRLYGPEVAGFMNLGAAEVKEIIDGDESDDTVSVDNVQKIWSRFRQELEEELGDG